MKIVLFEQAGARAAYGGVNGDTVSPLDVAGDTPQEQLLRLIDSPDLPSTRRDVAIPLAQIRLLAPVPRPGKIVVTTADYGASAAPRQLLATLKSPESVVGPGQTVRLPAVDGTWQFVPQAALGLVIRGPAKDVQAAQWQRAVFGYTCAIDVMASGDQQFGRDYWLAKADTLGPLGPCIVTVDEITEPASLRVRSWQNDGTAQDFRLADASHSIPEQIELVTTVMTLNSGDVVVCGSSAEGQRPVTDGDRIAVEIDRIGRLEVGVSQLVEVHL